MLALLEHVESVLQTDPAQSPQKVVSKTICWFLKELSMVQLPPPKEAMGDPHEFGLGFPEVMSLGILDLGKNQTLMAEDVHSVA